MTLYEIDQRIQACVDAETGEIIDADALDQLMLDRSAKVENIALWIKNLESDVVAITAEQEAFAERKKQTQAKIEGLKRYLAYALDGEKYHSTRCDVSFRRSEQVSIVDKDALPKKYFRITKKVEPDKTAIKDALKRGLKVKGAELVTNMNTQIK